MALKKAPVSIGLDYPYWMPLVLLALAFLIGGGSRADIQSLIVLRPLAVVCFIVALWAIHPQQLRTFRFLILFGSICLLLPLLQLIPLPPAIWTKLPGREPLAEVYRLADIAAPWQPLTLASAATWNSFYSLFVPAATLLLAIGSSRDQRFSTLNLLIAVGMTSGLLGLLQAIGPTDGPLYLYRITNNGLSVGLFANRNHQALMLAALFPMLAAFASLGTRSVEQARIRGWLAVGSGLLLVPLILVAGSRAGLLLGLLGLASAPLLYRRPVIDQPAKRKVRTIDLRYALGGAGLFAIALVTVLASRAQALERLMNGGAEDMRAEVWGPILQSAIRYFPFGSGLGSFTEVYQQFEPDALLAPQYLNHAHNDWLEALLTAGAAGALLLLVAAAAWARAALILLRRPVASRDALFGRLGVVLIFLFGAGSIVDYPLRVPSLAAVFALAAVWTATALKSAASKGIASTRDRGAANDLAAAPREFESGLVS